MRSFTPYAVRNRYPFLGPAPKIDREQALKLVQQVRNWAEQVIEPT